MLRESGSLSKCIFLKSKPGFLTSPQTHRKIKSDGAIMTLVLMLLCLSLLNRFIYQNYHNSL